MPLLLSLVGEHAAFVRSRRKAEKEGGGDDSKSSSTAPASGSATGTASTRSKHATVSNISAVRQSVRWAQTSLIETVLDEHEGNIAKAVAHLEANEEKYKLDHNVSELAEMFPYIPKEKIEQALKKYKS